MASDKLCQNVVSALCKHFSADSSGYLDDVATDLKSTCKEILKSSGDGDALQNNDAELAKWVAFTESLHAESASVSVSEVLSTLNEDLIKKAVILGPGLKPSAADVIVFAAVHPVVVGLPDSDTVKLPHLMRWMDYIQIKVGLQDLFTPIVLEKSQFKPPVVKATVKADSKEKKAVATESSTDKKKANEKETSGKDVDVSVSLLKIQIGLVCKASQHPSADSLLVEEIDIGESKNRQVVSGLAKHISPEQLTNRYVVLITNVKPSKLRDILSEGLVLCASNQDHSVVEPLIVPEGAKIGERVTFSGFEGEPEAVLNPKKKQLDKITPHLATDGSGIATFKGVPFMTSAGPCKSSIPNGSVK